uniref:Uncharacterized protein n=1 Tax=Steinernema glaseri TaxID=37863 RepID=A0A1I7YGM2_9BILA
MWVQGRKTETMGAPRGLLGRDSAARVEGMRPSGQQETSACALLSQSRLRNRRTSTRRSPYIYENKRKCQ